MLSQAVFWLGSDAAPRERTVGGVPFLRLIMNEVARHAVRDMLLLVADGEGWGHFVSEHGGGSYRARLVVAPAEAGIWAALRRAADLLEPRFFVRDGHSFLDINLLEFAREAARFSLLVARRRAAGAEASGGGGALAVNPGGVADVLPERARDGGVSVVAKTLLDEFDPSAKTLEHDMYRKLAVAGRLGVMAFGARFWDLRAFANTSRSLSEHLLRPALFLDRDGVINVDNGFPHRPDQIEWIDGALEAIRLANDRGYFVVVITNQSGVARGFYDEASVVSLHGWMRERFAEAGAHVDQFHYCPHHPDGVVPEYSRQCECRKPAPGMLLAALASGMRREGSVLVGDRASDLEAARGVGVAGHLFAGGNLKDFVEPLLIDWSGGTRAPG